MRIWTVTTNEDGGISTAVVYSEDQANSSAMTYVAANWGDYNSDKPMPDEWPDVLEALEDLGHMDSVHVEEHDVSGHPAIVAALAALTNLENDNGAAMPKSAWDLVQNSIIGLRDTPRPFTSTVMMHGFMEMPNGDTEHFDGPSFDGENPHGWHVWVRHDFIGVDPAKEETFDDDSTREAFFVIRDKAAVYATELSLELNCEIEKY